jgi:exodeoxyribonuclease V gamma subunit
MFHPHHSNHLEALAHALCETLRVPAGGPLEPEVVVVPNAGMARWVSLAVAQRLGVAANLDCPFPAGFIGRVLDAQWPDAGAGGAFDRGVLALRVLARLPDMAAQPGFEEVRRYLQGGDPALYPQRAWQLAQRIAGCFDRYQLYRPDWLADWEQGQEDHWQARLWRVLVEIAPGPHRARLYRDYLALPASALNLSGLPARVSVFGLAALAPVHLAVLRQLARAVDVHLYFPNPCAQYWGDVQSPRWQARARARTGAAPAFATSGHPLLASLGVPARDFFDQLAECDEADGHEHFVTPAGESLLARLQRDLLELAAPALAPVDPADRSITAHICHSPLREVQVLHDTLLAWFEADPALEPRDIVVLVPDPEVYAPHFAAVFGAAPAQRHIPYTLADRTPAAADPLVAHALALLDLPDSRLPATEVEAWLELPAVRAALDLPDEALPVLRHWVADSGARFGYDASARARAGLPADGAHTWRFGLDRLVLAHAAPGLLAGDVLALDTLAAGSPQWAGALAELVRRLDAWARALTGPHPPARWAGLVRGALAELFDPRDADEADALSSVRGALTQWEELAARAAYEAPLDRAVVRAQLTELLGQPGPARAFLTGAVTGCALTPMRAVPFRRVCVLGLDDGFPKRRPVPDFDRMADDRRRGDRVAREEDRAQFLDALLAAREAVHLSWVGRAVRDNTARPPSVVVGELLDVLRTMAGVPAVDALVTEHPLQPFSARYGTPGGPHTYAAQWFPAPQAPRPFTGDALPAVPAPDLTTLDQVVEVLGRPARAFLRQRLGIRLPRSADELRDDEPFVLEAGLERYGLLDAAVRACLDGAHAATVRETWRRTGALPGGAAGRAAFDALWAEADAFAAALRAACADALPDRDVALTLPDGSALAGHLRGRTSQGLLRWRPARLKGKDALTLWVAHLAACADGAALPARHVGRNDALTLAPVAAPHALAVLASLRDLAARLCVEALAFLPESAWAYSGGKDAEAGRKAAWKAWRDDDFLHVPGEGGDADVALVFRGREPLDEPAFAELADAVFGPLRAAAAPQDAP